MLKELFAEQRRYLDFFFDRLDIERAEKILQVCLQAKGLLIFTGVGKSGIVAEKIAMTMVSTGTKALHLPPTNFLHGDIGIVSADDVVLLLSKSGETEELLNIIPFLKRRSAATIAVVSVPQSRLASYCDDFISLPVEKELCPFDLAPTTSTEVQLLFGDALAVALMKAKGFSLDDYAYNHPSGTIGSKIKTTLTVGELMMHGDQIPICHPEDKLSDVLAELSNKKCGCLIVVDKQKRLQGIFTDGDLRRALQSQGTGILEQKLEILMTRTAKHTPRETLAWDAVKFMQKDSKKWIFVMPVVEDQKVVGVIRMHDIIYAGIS